MTYGELHMSCLRSNWPVEVLQLAIPLDCEHVIEDIDVTAILETRNAFCLCPVIEDHKTLGQGVFTKIAGFSFRGHPAFYALDGKIADITSARLMLSTVPKRILWALDYLRAEGGDAVLEIYPFVNIPVWSEFRLFIRGRKLVGVSQYHHAEAYVEIPRNIDGIKAAIVAFAPALIEALHMDTVVADVFVSPAAGGGFETTLIELNPFIQRTDPCLYTWQNGGNFDGGIRFRKAPRAALSGAAATRADADTLGLFREEDYIQTRRT